MKKYQFGFSAAGLIVFILIMLPNFIWFCVPAPHDVLRQESVTPFIDAAASVFQAIMITAICVLKRRDVRKITLRSPWILGCATAITLYFISWAAYYSGAANPLILLSLTILPCAAFLAYEIDRKNWIALIPTLAFTALHGMYCVLNFII